MSDEPEPNGWELLRGIKDLKESFDNLARGMVSEAMFTMYQANVANLMTQNIARIQALETALDDQRKNRAQMWFGIGISLLGSLGALVTGVVIWTLNH